ncbi:hypothetical protein CEUSTIGMA_g13013.t1 [Chlamydomonas eustigma]|uniref:SET domain-containing protein n=1 Tax=Chlamydomonas eustigma TaxID=1157962 RepID=A0A250XRB1_9CHLO|nr:hypothetical protein CEUSTIGMA_g13013.t1 [Chlamydomonas eustigma]|eukprot:GAX85598.1 hypothetical protein CEUSTIGMA_g13013.t1 [Chlamydomonas eustigma]
MSGAGPLATSNWSKLDISEDSVHKKARNLDKYRKEVERILKSDKPRKPDLQAFKNLNKELTPRDVYGHIPGVNIGEKFNNRGELAILGLHLRILQGIDGSPDTKSGAYAICLSGGYKDDEDEGTTFWYTGQGGQGDHGVQVKDQEMVKGNMALKVSSETQMPVRVVRGTLNNKQLQYVYEGLYIVKRYEMVPSSNGPLVIKFLMEGMPGESTASVKVHFNCMFKRTGARAMHGRKLAAKDTDEEDYDDVIKTEGSSKRKKVRDTSKQMSEKQLQLKKREVVLEEERKMRLSEIRGMAGVVLEDISHGLERLPIPLINEVNDRGLPPSFMYVQDYKFAPLVEELVRPILETEEQRMLQFMGGKACGIAYNRLIIKKQAAAPTSSSGASGILMEKRESPFNYNSSQLLKTTDCLGVHECDNKCKSKDCENNKQVTRGIRLPLEVYMTVSKGWGVKCADKILAGSFVCSYIGEVVTEPMAEVLENDEYIFSMEHFTEHIFQRMNEAPEEFQDIHKHRLPPAPPTNLLDLLTERVHCLRQSLEKGKRKDTASGAQLPAAHVLAPPESSVKDAVSNVETSPSSIGQHGAASHNHDSKSQKIGPSDVALGGDAVLQSAAGADVEAANVTEIKAKMNKEKVESNTTPPHYVNSHVAAQHINACDLECELMLKDNMDRKEQKAVEATTFESMQEIMGEDRVESDRCQVSAHERLQFSVVDASNIEPVPGSNIGSHPIQHQSAYDFSSSPDDREAAALRLPSNEQPMRELLAIDAARISNVARFINHSCEPNLIVQPVFAKKCRSTLLYYLSMFASQDIPAGEELTYSYGSSMTHIVNACQCGAAACIAKTQTTVEL